MEELIKFVAAGGSVTTILLLYYIYKIEPRMRSMEQTILQGQQVDLLKLVETLSHPDLHAKAAQILKNVEKQIKDE